MWQQADHMTTKLAAITCEKGLMEASAERSRRRCSMRALQKEGRTWPEVAAKPGMRLLILQQIRQLLQAARRTRGGR